MDRERSCPFVVAATVVLLITVPRRPASANPVSAAPDLTELSLTELVNLKVTSVSKKAEGRSRTPAAVFILTRDDIRRSGATTIPEILRLAPGVEVARIDSDHWSVGVRGFGDQFSKSLLVMIDGRSLYTPLFAGVHWAPQDTLLEDVERIEIIRGPGGTIWGSNAVNGVVNIITRRAGDTAGLLASAGAGTIDRVAGALRYGGGNGRGFDYRAYAKGFEREPEHHADGADFDDWRTVQVGGRADWTRREGETVTVQGDAYVGRHGQRVSIASFAPPSQRVLDDPADLSGGNVRARWERSIGGGGLRAQVYYDRTRTVAPQLEETRNTFDFDFVHDRTVLGSHRFSWGLGSRWSPSTFTPTVSTLDFTPRRQTTTLYSAFAQDQIPLLRNRLTLTLGAKLERNRYTGFELQPGARLLWEMSDQHTLWAAVTRAVRTPSRLERDFRLNGLLALRPLTYVQIDGSKAFESERLVGYETGYRALLSPRLYVDIATFQNDYDGLAAFGPPSFTVDIEPAPPHATLHFAYANGIRGRTAGLELTADGKPVDAWRLKASYSYLQMSLENQPGNADTGAVTRYEGSSPKHQAMLQSQLTLPRGLELDAALRYVSALPARDVDAYVTLDLRLGLPLGETLELSLAGQNLLQPRHAEFGHDPPPVVEIQRAAYARITWRR